MRDKKKERMVHRAQVATGAPPMTPLYSKEEAALFQRQSAKDRAVGFLIFMGVCISVAALFLWAVIRLLRWATNS
jgi:hypothetical protein